MFNELSTVFSVVSTVLLAVLIVVMYKFKRAIPDIQQVLDDVVDDVGESIGEQLTGIFEKPVVSKAMSVLGKKSGDKRANAALRNKAADAVMGQFPAARFVMDQIGITPIEGLQLMNDPMIGPIIKNMIASGSKGISNMLGNQGAPQGTTKGTGGDVFKVT